VDCHARWLRHASRAGLRLLLKRNYRGRSREERRGTVRDRSTPMSKRRLPGEGAAREAEAQLGRTARDAGTGTPLAAKRHRPESADTTFRAKSRSAGIQSSRRRPWSRLRSSMWNSRRDHVARALARGHADRPDRRPGRTEHTSNTCSQIAPIKAYFAVVSAIPQHGDRINSGGPINSRGTRRRKPKTPKSWRTPPK